MSPDIAPQWKTLGLDLSVAPGLNRKRQTKGDYYALAVGLGRGKGVSGLRPQTPFWKLRLVYEHTSEDHLQ